MSINAITGSERRVAFPDEGSRPLGFSGARAPGIMIGYLRWRGHADPYRRQKGSFATVSTCCEPLAIVPASQRRPGRCVQVGPTVAAEQFQLSNLYVAARISDRQ